MSVKERNNIIRLKMKLAVLLAEMQWYMPEEEFYETFPDTIQFLGGYW